MDAFSEYEMNMMRLGIWRRDKNGNVVENYQSKIMQIAQDFKVNDDKTYPEKLPFEVK